MRAGQGYPVTLIAILRPLVRDSLRLAFDLRSWRAGLKAARLPSLVIAAFSCVLGIVLAWVDGRGNMLNSACVLAAGLALQAGVNLVNDFFEFRQHSVDDKIAALGFSPADRELLEWLIFLVGAAFFCLAWLIGLFLAWRTGWPLLCLGIFGFAGGFFYTGEPLNYKRRGLAVVLVFFLMGVMMAAGSYYAVSATLSAGVVFVSVPLSLLVSLILLANELRDFESDTRYRIRTLAVRLGYNPAVALYCALLAAAYLLPVLLWRAGLFPHLRFLYFALPSAVPPFLFMKKPAALRMPIIPLVMVHHLAFGTLFCLTYTGALRGP
jgi:1,4-dihydroxy-2-naphthoate polyprenyltransferase